MIWDGKGVDIVDRCIIMKPSHLLTMPNTGHVSWFNMTHGIYKTYMNVVTNCNRFGYHG